MSDTKGLGKLIFVNTVDYKKLCRLHPGEYDQVHQYDEPQNTISIDRTVSAIALGPQYNLQGGYCFESLITGKHLWRSHWTPVNMSHRSMTSSVMLTGVRCERQRYLPFSRLSEKKLPWRLY